MHTSNIVEYGYEWPIVIRDDFWHNVLKESAIWFLNFIISPTGQLFGGEVYPMDTLFANKVGNLTIHLW